MKQLKELSNIMHLVVMDVEFLLEFMSTILFDKTHLKH